MFFFSFSERRQSRLFIVRMDAEHRKDRNNSAFVSAHPCSMCTQLHNKARLSYGERLAVSLLPLAFCLFCLLPLLHFCLVTSSLAFSAILQRTEYLRLAVDLVKLHGERAVDHLDARGGKSDQYPSTSLTLALTR